MACKKALFCIDCSHHFLLKQKKGAKEVVAWQPNKHMKKLAKYARRGQKMQNGSLLANQASKEIKVFSIMIHSAVFFGRFNDLGYF